MLPNSQYQLVTVGGHEYCIHRNEETLSGIDHATVLLSYHKNSLGRANNTLRVFI